MHARGGDRSPEERRTRHITAAVMRLHSLQVCASSHAARPGCFSAPPLSHTHSRREPGEGRRIRDGEMLIIRGEATDSSHMVWGCVSALGKGNLHFCDGTINAEKYIEILEHNMLTSRRHLFQGRPCIFQQDNAKPHSAHITKSWLRRRVYGYLTGLPAVPTCLQ